MAEEKACCRMFKKRMKEDPERFAFDNGGRCFACGTWHELDEVKEIILFCRKNPGGRRAMCDQCFMKDRVGQEGEMIKCEKCGKTLLFSAEDGWVIALDNNIPPSAVELSGGIIKSVGFA